MKKLITYTLLILLSFGYSNAYSMIGEWERDTDATVQLWKENGALRADETQTIEEKEKLVRDKLFRPLRVQVSEGVYLAIMENKEVSLNYVIEQQGEDWILFSGLIAGKKDFTLWRFKDEGIVHSTVDTTGDLDALMSSRIIDVFVRN
jgi:hypothetical protein